MTVRISATDWVEDGQTLEDALAVAGAFATPAPQRSTSRPAR